MYLINTWSGTVTSIGVYDVLQSSHGPAPPEATGASPRPPGTATAFRGTTAIVDLPC